MSRKQKDFTWLRDLLLFVGVITLYWVIYPYSLEGRMWKATQQVEQWQQHEFPGGPFNDHRENMAIAIRNMTSIATDALK